MIISIFILLFISIIFFPISIIYYLLVYMFFYGFAETNIMNNLKISVGNINIYILDYLFITMITLICIQITKHLIGFSLFNKSSIKTKYIFIILFIYLLYYSIHLIIGYFDNVPIDTLVRLYYIYAQSLYFIVPIVCIKNEVQLKRILYFIVILSCAFPFIQLTLTGTSDTLFTFAGQNTLRLGHGAFSSILAFSMLALLCWEKWIATCALPGAGLIMLAHRSAYIGIFMSAFSLAYLKGKTFKTLLLLSLAGATIIVLLFVMQSVTSVRVFERGIQRAGETFQKTGTTKARLDALRDSLTVFQRHPFFGLGYHQEYLLQKKEEVNAFAFNVLHPHNFILKSLTSGGILGTGLLLWIIAYGLRCAHRLSQIEGRREAGSYLFSCLLFFLVFCTMNANFETDGYLFWLLLGTVFWYFNQDASQACMSQPIKVKP